MGTETNMKKLIITLIGGALCLSAVPRAQARIGWTMQQCVTQYGQPTIDNGKIQNDAIKTIRTSGEDWKTYIFQVEGMSIYTSFYQGVVSNVAYQPDSDLTLAQAKAILAKNASNWKKDSANSDDTSDEFISTANQHKLRASLWWGTSGDFLKYNKDGDIIGDHNVIQYLIIVDETANIQLQAARDTEEQQDTNVKDKAQQDKQQKGLDKI